MATVEIFGSHYKIKGTLTAERIRALARYVDQRMRQVERSAGVGDPTRVAVLAALNIANDYYETKKALEKRQDETKARAEELLEILDEALHLSDEAVGSSRSPRNS